MYLGRKAKGALRHQLAPPGRQTQWPRAERSPAGYTKAAGTEPVAGWHRLAPSPRTGQLGGEGERGAARNSRATRAGRGRGRRRPGSGRGTAATTRSLRTPGDGCWQALDQRDKPFPRSSEATWQQASPRGDTKDTDETTAITHLYRTAPHTSHHPSRRCLQTGVSFRPSPRVYSSREFTSSSPPETRRMVTMVTRRGGAPRVGARGVACVRRDVAAEGCCGQCA